MVESQEGTAARQHHSSVTPQQPPESLILVHEEADGVCVKACGDYSGLISGPTALVCATGEKIALSNDFVRMFGGMGAAVELDSPSQISAATAASTSARKQFNVVRSPNYLCLALYGQRWSLIVSPLHGERT